MNEMKRLFTGFLVAMAAVGLVIVGGCAQQAQRVAKDSPLCAAEGMIEKNVAPEAQLEEFSCFFKKWSGAETLHFKVKLKNVSDKDQRFRVKIYLDNGKAVGGLIPRKTKKGLIKPGASGSFVYPVSGMPTKPESVILHVTPGGS